MKRTQFYVEFVPDGSTLRITKGTLVSDRETGVRIENAAADVMKSIVTALHNNGLQLPMEEDLAKAKEKIKALEAEITSVKADAAAANAAGNDLYEALVSASHGDWAKAKALGIDRDEEKDNVEEEVGETQVPPAEPCSDSSPETPQDAADDASLPSA
jgi:cobalamin biosynthesis Mg chelatase CobN